MPSKKTPTTLVCICGKTNIIQCLANRDYSKWRCRSCVIKTKWQDKDYATKVSQASSTRWSNTEFRQKQTKILADRSRNSRALISQKITSLWQNAQYRASVSKSCADKWNDVDYRSNIINKLTGRKLSKEHITAIKIALKPIWASQEWRDKISESLRTPECKAIRTNNSKALWLDPEYRKKYSTEHYKQKVAIVSRLLWQNKDYRAKVLTAKSTPEFKAKMAVIRASDKYVAAFTAGIAKQASVSKLQECLYSMLDDLGVKYYREYLDRPSDKECMIGPWPVDCVVPRDNKRALVIECNGDWIHNQPAKRASDKSKATYINTYCSDLYELKYLWEHEFVCKDRILWTLQYWLGVKQSEVIGFDFSQIEIKHCPADEYRPLLSKYHYLANAGRGGIAYGAYFCDTLIAVCVFSPLGRQNIDVPNSDSARDLSRLCIHPSYQKHNFASWFVSRCIGQLPETYKTIIAYCDTTFNHTGAVYKSLNFVEDKVVKPDYWYRSNDGWVMHKKTLYNRATNLNMTEAAYAEAFNFMKVFGFEKIRFSLKRT